MPSKEMPYEIALIEQAMTSSIEILKSDHNPDLDYMNLHCKIGEEDLETSAFGLIYTLSLLSFRDAKPAGASEADFDDDDCWYSRDMLRCLRFLSGLLYFESDYECGRRMKTTITVDHDGILTVQTNGRGTSAKRWIAMLQGKSVLTVIRGEKP